MAKLAVSFRIDNSTGAYTYGERYSSFMAELRKTGIWEETTSFGLTTTSETAEQLCDRLYFKSHFDPSRDLMIVINVETGVGVTKGEVQYPHTLAGKLNKLIQK